MYPEAGVEKCFIVSKKRSQEEIIESEVMVDEWKGEEHIWIGGTVLLMSV